MNTKIIDRNKYADDKMVKWIVARRRYDGEWVIRYVSILHRVPTLEKVLDETPIGEIKVSEFGVFRNRPDWWIYNPSRYYRGCDVPVIFGSAVGALINALQSDWF